MYVVDLSNPDYKDTGLIVAYFIVSQTYIKNNNSPWFEMIFKLSRLRLIHDIKRIDMVVTGQDVYRYSSFRAGTMSPELEGKAFWATPIRGGPTFDSIDTLQTKQCRYTL
jgi:hypothetical protein